MEDITKYSQIGKNLGYLSSYLYQFENVIDTTWIGRQIVKVGNSFTKPDIVHKNCKMYKDSGRKIIMEFKDIVEALEYDESDESLVDLSICQKLRAIILFRCKTINYILPQSLTNLHAYHCENINLSSIYCLYNLISINIDHCNGSSLLDLSKCTKLQKYYCNNTEIDETILSENVYNISIRDINAVYAEILKGKSLRIVELRNI